MRQRTAKNPDGVVAVVPPEQGRVTGGFLVNRELLRAPAVRRAETAGPARLAEQLRAIPDAHPVIVDSLYLFDVDAAAQLDTESRRRRVLLLAHSLPSLIPGPAVDDRRQALEGECALLSTATGAVAPSVFMAGALERRGLPRGRIKIVPPAPICDGRSRRSTRAASRPATSDVPIVLTVANWHRSKGLADAARALSELADIPWSWVVAGDRASDPTVAAQVDEITRSAGVTERVRLLPIRRPDELRRYYRSARLLLLPSCMESYGIVFAEALSHGVPAVGYRAGAVPDVVGDAGVLVPAGARTTLREALRELLSPGRDSDDRIRTLAASASKRAASLPTWEESRSAFTSALYSLLSDRRPAL
jgi:glycosyltransferase involved in cell wall biosynthesis